MAKGDGPEAKPVGPVPGTDLYVPQGRRAESRRTSLVGEEDQVTRRREE